MNVDMLLMVEQRIRCGRFKAIHQDTESNNKYMKDYDTNRESPYLTYWKVNNFKGYAM